MEGRTMTNEYRPDELRTGLRAVTNNGRWATVIGRGCDGYGLDPADYSDHDPDRRTSCQYWDGWWTVMEDDTDDGPGRIYSMDATRLGRHGIRMSDGSFLPSYDDPDPDRGWTDDTADIRHDDPDMFHGDGGPGPDGDGNDMSTDAPWTVDDSGTDPETNSGRVVTCHGHRLTVPPVGHGPSIPCPRCRSVFETDRPDAVNFMDHEWMTTNDPAAVVTITTDDDTMTDMDRWIDGGPTPSLAAGDIVTVTCRNCGLTVSTVIPPSPVDPVSFIVNRLAAVTAAPCRHCGMTDGQWTVDRGLAAGYALDDMEDMAAGVVDMATVTVDYSDGSSGHVTVAATTADDIVTMVERMTGRRMNVTT